MSAGVAVLDVAAREVAVREVAVREVAGKAAAVDDVWWRSHRRAALLRSVGPWSAQCTRWCPLDYHLRKEPDPG